MIQVSDSKITFLWYDLSAHYFHKRATLKCKDDIVTKPLEKS